jgi:hypothetical protein
MTEFQRMSRHLGCNKLFRNVEAEIRILLYMPDWPSYIYNVPYGHETHFDMKVLQA